MENNTTNAFDLSDKNEQFIRGFQAGLNGKPFELPNKSPITNQPHPVGLTELDSFKFFADNLAALFSEVANIEKLSAFKRNDCLAQAFGYKGHTHMIEEAKFRGLQKNEGLFSFTDGRLHRIASAFIKASRKELSTKASYNDSLLLVRNAISLSFIRAFSTGASTEVTGLIEGLIKSFDGNSERRSVFNAIGENALLVLVSGLVDLRDNQVLILSMQTILEHFTLNKMIEMTSNPNISNDSKEQISKFLLDIGWDENKGSEQQSQSMLDLFQYGKAYYGLGLQRLIII